MTQYYSIVQKLFWNNPSTVFSMSFAVFVQIFSNKTASLLKVSASIAYPFHVVLINFSNVYKRWLVQSGHALVTFFSVEFATEQQKVNKELSEMEESFYEYSSSSIIAERDWSPVTSSSDKREPRTRTLHKSMSIKLSNMEDNCLQKILDRTG